MLITASRSGPAIYRTIPEAQQAVQDATDRFEFTAADYHQAIKLKKRSAVGLAVGIGGTLSGLVAKAFSPELALGLTIAGGLTAAASGVLMVHADMRATERAIEYPYHRDAIGTYRQLLEVVTESVERQRREMQELARGLAPPNPADIVLEQGFVVINGIVTSIRDDL